MTVHITIFLIDERPQVTLNVTCADKKNIKNEVTIDVLLLPRGAWLLV